MMSVYLDVCKLVNSPIQLKIKMILVYHCTMCCSSLQTHIWRRKKSLLILSDYPCFIFDLILLWKRGIVDNTEFFVCFFEFGFVVQFWPVQPTSPWVKGLLSNILSQSHRPSDARHGGRRPGASLQWEIRDQSMAWPDGRIFTRDPEGTTRDCTTVENTVGLPH